MQHNILKTVQIKMHSYIVEQQQVLHIRNSSPLFLQARANYVEREVAGICEQVRRFTLLVLHPQGDCVTVPYRF